GAEGGRGGVGVGGCRQGDVGVRLEGQPPAEVPTAVEVGDDLPLAAAAEGRVQAAVGVVPDQDEVTAAAAGPPGDHHLAVRLDLDVAGLPAGAADLRRHQAAAAEGRVQRSVQVVP